MKNENSKIAYISLVVSIAAFVCSAIFSYLTISSQNEANAIQKQFAEVERNSKIAKLVAEYNSKIHMDIDFHASKEEVVQQVTTRSEGILLTLNNLFLISRGTHAWDKYIQDASKWPLGSLKRRKTSVRCNVWSPDFKKFLFQNKLADECTICKDVNCEQ